MPASSVNQHIHTPKTRSQKAKVISRGRAANSLPNSPVVGASGGFELGLSLADIPANAGPAVLHRGSSRFIHPQHFMLDDEEGSSDSNAELERLIQQEEVTNKRLERERRLFELRNRNLRLKNDISAEQVDFETELHRRRPAVTSGRPASTAARTQARSVNQAFDEQRLQSEGNLGQAAASYAVRGSNTIPQQRPVSAIANVTKLPTLQQVQDQSRFPTLNQLRADQQLQASWADTADRPLGHRGWKQQCR